MEVEVVTRNDGQPEVILPPDCQPAQGHPAIRTERIFTKRNLITGTLPQQWQCKRPISASRPHARPKSAGKPHAKTELQRGEPMYHKDQDLHKLLQSARSRLRGQHTPGDADRLRALHAQFDEQVRDVASPRQSLKMQQRPHTAGAGESPKRLTRMTVPVRSRPSSAPSGARMPKGKLLSAMSVLPQPSLVDCVEVVEKDPLRGTLDEQVNSLKQMRQALKLWWSLATADPVLSFE